MVALLLVLHYLHLTQSHRFCGYYHYHYLDIHHMSLYLTLSLIIALYNLFSRSSLTWTTKLLVTFEHCATSLHLYVLRCTIILPYFKLSYPILSFPILFALTLAHLSLAPLSRYYIHTINFTTTHFASSLSYNYPHQSYFHRVRLFFHIHSLFYMSSHPFCYHCFTILINRCTVYFPLSSVSRLSMP